eukprot:scaffold21331_cov117-Isochrysis_galbana.AAC.7
MKSLWNLRMSRLLSAKAYGWAVCGVGALHPRHASRSRSLICAPARRPHSLRFEVEHRWDDEKSASLSPSRNKRGRALGKGEGHKATES